ncbi:hypothetical protein [Bradyrhizobium sp. LHD-71]|uniref:hypothetical protein n=1 Tax=Bradyrhizobium sp. LHD-71 TaxID=3072141 RepID=UPI00280F703C|nr:hypothetical protein [Bradyrhizobium sp. LHD-71]MDQ8728666.1 hypothetical protein [Bradyrhizobium sp. LHD-71]
MTKEQPKPADDGDHVVIKFRPRTSAEAPKTRTAQVSPLRPPPPDLSRYEQSSEPDDYRHRMRMNIAAGLFTVALIGFGVWLAMSIADLRRTQDCILYGRRDCAVIPQPSR